MKIGLDARYLIGQKPGGVGVYISNLINYLTQNGVECVLFYNLYCSDYKALISSISKSRIKLVKIPIKSRSEAKEVLFWEQVLLPQAIKKEKIDIYHATENRGIPITTNIPSVLTLHDIIPLLEPRNPSLSNYKTYYEVSSKISFGKADKIICISNSTKKDFLEYFNKKNQKKLKVIYNSIDTNKIEKKHKYTDKEIKNLLYKHDLKMGNYLLSLGGTNSRKNLDRLIKAYNIVKKQGYPIKLLILGSFDSKYYPKLKKLINRLGLNNDIVFSGYVSEPEKYKFLAGAKCLTYPSLSEGFGLPILEAFFYKIPIIISNIPALSEVGGKAVIKINPCSIKEISQAILKVLENEKLQKKLVKKGLIRAESFSVEKMGRETLETYKSILKKKIKL